jgi:hypothetical protein
VNDSVSDAAANTVILPLSAGFGATAGGDAPTAVDGAAGVAAGLDESLPQASAQTVNNAASAMHSAPK